jgi:hypothetical protein
MRKKSGFTFVEQAIVLVPEFEMVVHKLEQQVTLRGQSRSTLQSNIRIACIKASQVNQLSTRT